MNFKQIAYNRTKRTQPIKHIVIHDTGNKGQGANAESHYKYFNGGDRDSSADFFVDDTEIWQVNDYNKFFTWHCGDGKGRYGITNDNSIGVEMCINSGGDFEKAFANTIELTKLLMAQLNISADNVVRHYDASRKSCPDTFKANNWERWHRFKKLLTESEEPEMIYNYIDENMPEWARPTIQKLVDKGVLKGNEHGELGLNDTMLKLFVAHDRLGLYDK